MVGRLGGLVYGSSPSCFYNSLLKKPERIRWCVISKQKKIFVGFFTQGFVKIITGDNMNKELINKIKLKIEKTFGLARIYIYSIKMVRKNRTYICLSCSDVDGMLKEIDTESPIGKEIATFGMDSFEVKKEKCFVTSNKEKILNAYNEQVIKHEAIYRGYNKCK